ncbi:unnamed protein product, partial [Staurois parvus]
LQTQGITDHGKSRRCRLVHVISCIQSQLITWDMYTDHQGTDDHCALMISVAPAVPPVKVHQCQLSVPISATSMPHSAYQCTSMPHMCPSELPFSVIHQCQSVPPINANQCHLSVLPISATYQCQSVPPISASQCRLSVCISATYQCQSVPPNSAIYQCHVSVLPFSAHQ